MNKTLVIKPNEFTFDKEGYDFTKVVSLKCFSEGRPKIVSKQPTTWASLIREVINTYYYEIDKLVERNYSEFEFLFNTALSQMIKEWGGRTNTSFSEKLFQFPLNTERETMAGNYPEHLHSTVYKNNANSLLKIFEIPDSTEGMFITAVYSGEVVWVLNALVSALEEFNPTIEIEYFKRDKKPDFEGQVNLDDMVSTNEDALENDEEITDIKGNADIDVKVLKLKLGEMYKKDEISKENYDYLNKYVDKLNERLVIAKSDLASVRYFANKINADLFE